MTSPSRLGRCTFRPCIFISSTSNIYIYWSHWKCYFNQLEIKVFHLAAIYSFTSCISFLSLQRTSSLADSGIASIEPSVLSGVMRDLVSRATRLEPYKVLFPSLYLILWYLMLQVRQSCLWSTATTTLYIWSVWELNYLVSPLCFIFLVFQGNFLSIFLLYFWMASANTPSQSCSSQHSQSFIWVNLT